MQITFSSPRGTPITVGDPRTAPDAAAVDLPDERAPAAWIMGRMHVATPEERRPSSWIMTAMTVDLPEERRPAGWIMSTMKV